MGQQTNQQSTQSYTTEDLKDNWFINKLVGSVDMPNMESDMRGLIGLLKNLTRIGVITPAQQDRAQHFYGRKLFKDKYGTKDAFIGGLGHEVEGAIEHGHSLTSMSSDLMNNIMGLKDDSKYDAKDFFNLLSKHSPYLKHIGHITQLGTETSDNGGAFLPADLTDIPNKDIKKILDYIDYSDSNTWMPPEFEGDPTEDLPYNQIWWDTPSKTKTMYDYLIQDSSGGI